MGHKALLALLLLLCLGFCFVSSSAAVPTTRVLKSSFADPSVENMIAEDARDLKIDSEDSFEVMAEEEASFEGRMALENTDYPGTGANNHHDPRSPAKP